MGKRRGHGEGAIYQRESDGLWCTCVDLGIINGKRRRKVIYGKTRKEVAEKLKAMHRDQLLGVHLSSEQLTTGAFLDRWLQQVVAIRNRPRTHISYSDTVRLYIKPHLGTTLLLKLTPEHVQAMLNALSAQSLAPRTVTYTRAVLRKALNQALRWGHVHRNVATLVDVPAARRHARRSRGLRTYSVCQLKCQVTRPSRGLHLPAGMWRESHRRQMMTHHRRKDGVHPHPYALVRGRRATLATKMAT